jgi:prepilin-type N-terminal cleavage/methylation domain-containing protein
MKKGTERVLQPSNESGMTLMEVMVSMVVMGVVLVALGQGLTLGIRMNAESKTKIANLNLCKRITEQLKSQVESSQTAFDGANLNTALNRSFYVDADGNEISTTGYSAASAFRVTVGVSNWIDASGNPMSAVDATGVSHVLVKSLSVTVVAEQSAIGTKDASTAANSSRETVLKVEMVRPAVA